MKRSRALFESLAPDDWVGYLTDSGSNFRLDIATILPYKGNRSGTEKPPLWKGLREYLMEAYPDQVTEVVGIEADDQLAIDQYTSYDIAARALVDTGCTPYEFSAILEQHSEIYPSLLVPRTYAYSSSHCITICRIY